MVDAEAIRVKSRWIRITGVKLGDAGCRIIGAVRQRIGIQKWLNGGYSAGSRARVGNARQSHLRQTKPKSFVREKEKRAVLQDWAAEGSSEIILSFLRLSESGLIGKPTICVKQ